MVRYIPENQLGQVHYANLVIYTVENVRFISESFTVCTAYHKSCRHPRRSTRGATLWTAVPVTVTLAN